MAKRQYGSWDMAGFTARTYKPERPRVMHGPVGKPYGELAWALRGDAKSVALLNSTIGHCLGCGYHVCSCKPAQSSNPWEAMRDASRKYMDQISGLNSVARGEEVARETDRMTGAFENAQQMRHDAQRAIERTTKRAGDTTITESEYGRMLAMGAGGRASRYGDSPRLQAFNAMHGMKIREQDERKRIEARGKRPNDGLRAQELAIRRDSQYGNGDIIAGVDYE